MNVCVDGERKILRWMQDGTIWKMLNPRDMKWFRGLTTCIEDLRHPNDPKIDKPVYRMNQDEVQCEEILEDGQVCQFTGRPADVGVHKYYVHKKCNPIKATVLTNACPGCGEILASTRSAKEHAHRSWKQGKCARGKVSRPYSFSIEQAFVENINCPICQVYLETRQDVTQHMRMHFLALVPAQAQQPPMVPAQAPQPPSQQESSLLSSSPNQAEGIRRPIVADGPQTTGPGPSKNILAGVPRRL